MLPKNWPAKTGAVLLGLLFLVAAAGKMRGLPAFEGLLVQRGFAGSLVVAGLEARGLIAVELFLGLAWFQPGLRRRLILPATLGLLAVFSVYLGYLGLIRGDRGDCGCLGDLMELAPLPSLAKNLVMIAIGIHLYRRLEPDAPGAWRVPAQLAVLALGLVFVAFPLRRPPPAPAAGSPTAKVSRFAGFRRFHTVREQDLSRQRCLVAFFSLDCEHCLAAAEILARLGKVPGPPPVYLVFLGGADQVEPFLTKSGANFPYLLASPADFFQFIEAEPPAIYLLKDGEVEAKWGRTDFAFEAVRDRWYQGRP